MNKMNKMTPDEQSLTTDERDVFLEFRNALMANAGGILPKARKRDEATSVFRLICKPTMGRRHLPLAHKC